MKIGFLFPGYGNQYVGMGKDLYDQSRIMQEFFEIASSCLDINFVKLCFASSDAELAHVTNAYVALFLINSALYSILKEIGITPQLIAGHGIGEYAAVYASGGISFPDALYLLNKYAHFYSEALANHQLGVLHIQGGDDALLEELCKECTTDKDFVTIAIHNASDDHYIAGTAKSIEHFRTLTCARDGIECEDADEGHGIHALMMEAVHDKLKMYLPKVDFKDLHTPMITCVDGVQIKSGEPAKMCLVRQISNPILWGQVLANFADCDVIITVGPGDKLKEIARARYPEKLIVSFSTLKDLEYIKDKFIDPEQSEQQLSKEAIDDRDN
jgi:[acyl-carrier-protein] S-malonyltransferase